MSTESEFPEGKVVSFMKNIISGGEEDAFIVMDLEDVKSKLRAWKEHLPRGTSTVSSVDLIMY